MTRTGPAVSAGAAVALQVQPPTLGDSARIGAAAALNIALGLLQQWYILIALGPGREADALFAAFAVPNVLIANAMTPVTQVLVPLLAVESGERLRSAAWTFFIGLGALFAVLACALAVSAPLWLPWTLPGFDAGALELAVQLLRVQSLALLFTPLSLVLWAIHQARSRFLTVELSTAGALLGSLALSVWGVPRFGVAGAAAAFALKPLLQTLFLLRGLGRPCWPHWRSSTVSEAWRRLRPLFLGNAYCRTDQIFDRLFASMSAPGSITLLFMAQQIYIAANTVLNKALIGPLAPTLAVRSLHSDGSALSGLVRRRLLLLGTLALLGLAGLVAVGHPLLGAIFGWGRFDAEQISALWRILLVLSGSFLAFAPISVLSAAFYAAGNTRTPVLVTSGVYTAAVLLRAALFARWGVLGIALAVSAQQLATAGALLLCFRAEHRRRGH